MDASLNARNTAFVRADQGPGQECLLLLLPPRFLGGFFTLLVLLAMGGCATRLMTCGNAAIRRDERVHAYRFTEPASCRVTTKTAWQYLISVRTEVVRRVDYNI